ncbi:hypothetical protein [Gordonia sp. NB41Y]|uniref:hypothetical protein n=1 Tax=Gordonia sp. NB41Y TaxID=875808 RepID=UPI00273C6F46|nr:hypothetical protein [Gordonia sp. NB41Y]WLP91951.1 hypothetical protein Q9K23_06820 [Gordonia sp. NB41Y]
MTTSDVTTLTTRPPEVSTRLVATLLIGSTTNAQLMIEPGPSIARTRVEISAANVET